MILLTVLPLLLLAGASVTSSALDDVLGVDVLKRENCVQHSTCKYRQMWLNSHPSIVLRRGALFNMTMRLRRPYNPKIHNFHLEISHGLRPQLSLNTLIDIPVVNDINLSDEDRAFNWFAYINDNSSNLVGITIGLPADTPVGIWQLRVVLKNSTLPIRDSIYIIFNSWSEDDGVYLEREDLRQEYLLNENGKIYIGTYFRPMSRKWLYGQFHEAVLPGVMMLLDRTRLTIDDRTNVVKVSRAVSAAVNSHDESGLLVGNWSGNYHDGIAPSSWTGSAPIFEKYLTGGGRPVKFGQCWVFAGVTTTALRTLGIPARTITNFVSAHDTDDSLTVDKFFSERGEPIEGINGDSIWNFHVWSDAWMSRPDLPPGYDGWQVIDATPQEMSMGKYQSGPASLTAIKNGNVDFAYDTGFVFAEVNADVVNWQLDSRRNSQWRKMSTLKNQIGRSMYTKKIGYFEDAMDVVNEYKYREGTAEERSAVLKAARVGGLSFFFEQI